MSERTRAYRRHHDQRATSRAQRRVRQIFGLSEDEFTSREDLNSYVNMYATDRCPHRERRQLDTTPANRRADLTEREQRDDWRTL